MAQPALELGRVHPDRPAPPARPPAPAPPSAVVTVRYTDFGHQVAAAHRDAADPLRPWHTLFGATSERVARSVCGALGVSPTQLRAADWRDGAVAVHAALADAPDGRGPPLAFVGADAAAHPHARPADPAFHADALNLALAALARAHPGA